MGCELPQNKEAASSEAVSDGEDVDVETAGDSTWKMLRITDRDGTDLATMPGADIDAIVVFRDGEFISAGCANPTLFGVAEGVHEGNAFVSVEKATLDVREQSEGSGFVSLGGGSLVCELPVAVLSGDSLEIWEVEADARDAWKVALAETADADYVELSDWVEGSMTFEVP